MLESRVQELAEGKNFAVLTTRMKDGSAQSHVMWVGHDGDHLLINTEIHRTKFRNMEREPRVTVCIIDAESPYRFAEVRGTVVGTVRGPEAKAHIDALSAKYTGNPVYQNAIQTERVIVEIRPDRQIVR